MCGFADRGSGQKHKFRVELLAVGRLVLDVADRIAHPGMACLVLNVRLKKDARP